MKQAVPPTEALDELGASLKTMLAASRRLRGRETQRPGQLSQAQYTLLFGLEATSEQSSVDLARNAALTPATVAPMLDALESAGLVTRRRSEHDKRVVLTALTTRGAEVIAERRASIDPLWRGALADLGEDDLRAAAAVLDRIAGFFDDLHEIG
jgi:DNA-binding MarR family transcriptional regulator